MASPMEIKSRSMDDKQATTKRKIGYVDLQMKIKRSAVFVRLKWHAKKSTLIAHAKSKKHIKKSRIIDPTLPSASDDKSCVDDKEETKENMQKAEIMFAAFIATHNIPLSCVDDMVAVFNKVSVMKGVPGQMVLSRKKFSNIINNVLGEKQSQDLSQNLSDTKFSVLVDESTTTADATDYSALKLYEAFDSSFEERNVSLTNIVAVASDNALVMVGKYDSFVTRLRKVNPNLIVLNCICHTSALIASNIVQIFYTQLEHIFLAVPKESIENKSKNSADIYNGFTNDELHSYLLFLEISLNTFNVFNALFQSRETYIHILAERSEWMLKQMAMCFLKTDALNNITINLMLVNNIVRQAGNTPKNSRGSEHEAEMTPK
ncbi:hypothetical protein PV328_001305 [Microctonus aethiopoides]|uniref:Uncharacterized protein n=1 Tax=Microctonus aethiopoides TaxID=144406 RepID=A0AA39FXU5_9HYME|nr:hypothetical protein PV328_001305 [Microctonus aethiopoides]